MPKIAKSNAPWAIHGEALITDDTALDSVISLNQAVTYLAAKLPPSRDPIKTIKDRIRKAISGALKAGKLMEAETRKYVFSEFVRWAQSTNKYASCVVGVQLPASATITATLPALSVQASGFTHPQSIEEWRDEVIRLRSRIRELEAKANALQAENETLLLLKHAKDIQRMNARKGGQKGGRGRKRT